MALDSIGVYYVSIHAPYAGSDASKTVQQCHYLVSIHAPYAGSDDIVTLS